MSKDPELERLFSRVLALEGEYNSACTETDFYKNQMNQEWSSLHNLQVQYRELKEQADEEFQSASLCWEMGDRASAKEHSENGKALNERKAYLSSGLDMAHSRFDPMKEAFERAKEHQAEVLERLKEARAAKNRRLDELIQSHWRSLVCRIRVWARNRKGTVKHGIDATVSRSLFKSQKCSPRDGPSCVWTQKE